MDEIKLITSEPKKADQKFFTSSAVLQRAVNINIAALMTMLKRPKVRSTNGKVINFRNEPKKLLMRPRSKATQRNFQAPP